MPQSQVWSSLLLLAASALVGCSGGEDGPPADPVAAMERRLDCRPSDAGFAPLRVDVGPLGQCLLRALSERRLPKEAEQNGLAVCVGGLRTLPPEALTDAGVAACLIENGVDPNKDGGP